MDVEFLPSEKNITATPGHAPHQIRIWRCLLDQIIPFALNAIFSSFYVALQFQDIVFKNLSNSLYISDFIEKIILLVQHLVLLVQHLVLLVQHLVHLAANQVIVHFIDTDYYLF